jgi:hypothetical protein
MKIENANGLSQEQFLVFAKAKAIVEIYEAASVIDNNLDNVKFVATLWDQANVYEREIAYDIVKGMRSDAAWIPLPYSIAENAYDVLAYREVLCETISAKTRAMVKEQVEAKEHELAFELVSFMQENEITL